MRILSALTLSCFVTACSHPLEIVGEGDIISASGNRDCLLENSIAAQPSCTQNLVAGAYTETYFAVPRAGWKFDSWVNYCADAVTNECSFVATAGQVFSFWGAIVPPLRALFIADGCEPIEGVEFLPPINWASQGAQTRIALAVEIKTAEFTSTSNTGYIGQISIAATTGTSNISRRVWISECPGGESLAEASCEKVGTSSTVVRWGQQPSENRCSLETDTRYYLNVQNINCLSASCDVYLNRYTNGLP